MMITAELAVIASLLISNVQLQELDLSQSLKDCLASGNSINVCSKEYVLFIGFVISLHIQDLKIHEAKSCTSCTVFITYL